MDTKTIILFLWPIIIAILSSYLTYFFAIRTKKNEAMLRFKEEKYSNLLVLLQGFIGKTAEGKTKKEFFKEQYRSWIYSSDGVVRAINEMVQLVIDSEGKEPDPNEGEKVVGNIIIEMRKDLLGKTKLTFKDFYYTDVVE